MTEMDGWAYLLGILVGALGGYWFGIFAGMESTMRHYRKVHEEAREREQRRRLEGHGP